MKALFCLIALLIPVYALADLPENDLWRYDDVNFVSAMDEATFNAVIKEVSDIYTPIAEALGFTLKIEGDWNDSTVNAYTQRLGKEWYVAMFGGLARRPEITIDGFKLVICHEIAHQMGGAPMSAWASYEGQADYIGAHVCGKKVFSKSPRDVLISKYCDGYKNKEDQRICSQNLEAGQSLATLLAALEGVGSPKLNTPDTNVVRKTQSAHPHAQCRLDTYLAGSVCQKAWDDKIIPTDLKAVCSNRPRCWYKS